MSVDLSVVVVSFNTRELLANCLATVQAQAHGRPHELVVVDNASADGSAEMVAGVWMGNDDDRAMVAVTGGGLPAQLWRGFMADALAGRPARPLPSVSAPMGRVIAPIPTALISMETFLGWPSSETVDSCLSTRSRAGSPAGV